MNNQGQDEILESFLDNRVKVLVGDIARQNVDAIVNAANSTLLGGGGVDGAIHRVGGPRILEECREIRRTRYPEGLPTGEAVITTGGNLPVLYVIHTVGPIYGKSDGRDAELLANCYSNSLLLAVEKNLASIAFPSIFDWRVWLSARRSGRVSSRAIAEFFSSDRQLQDVRLVFFAMSDANVFLKNHGFRRC